MDIADGRWDDYMTLKKAQDRIHQAAGGLVYSWNFRQLDADNGGLLLIRKTSRAHHMRYVESLMKSQLRDTGPQNTSKPRGDYMEYYEVIDGDPAVVGRPLRPCRHPGGGRDPERRGP